MQCCTLCVLFTAGGPRWRLAFGTLARQRYRCGGLCAARPDDPLRRWLAEARATDALERRFVQQRVRALFTCGLDWEQRAKFGDVRWRARRQVHNHCRSPCELLQLYSGELGTAASHVQRVAQQRIVNGLLNPIPAAWK